LFGVLEIVEVQNILSSFCPLPQKLTTKIIYFVLGTLPRNVSLSHSVKFVPGDPMSPYIVSSSANEDTTSTK
jgi:hypothetical protein